MDTFPVALVNEKNSAERFKTHLSYSWPWTLNLAFDNGWEPAGTLEPSNWRSLDYNDRYISQYTEFSGWELPGAYNRGGTFRPDPTSTWSGTYVTDQRQVVTAEDARSLADALERATVTPINHKIEITVSRAFRYCTNWSVNDLLTMEAEELGSLYEDVPRLVTFCRSGAFHIGGV
jgi:hypothetical protein